MWNPIIPLLAFPVIIQATNFTIIKGQIFTPGLAIVDAPQPYTPLGGDSLHIALDISLNGRLPLPPYAPSAQTATRNITIFLYSYITSLNLTITNGTSSTNNASLGNILAQELGSTIKHVNWLYPSCFIGNGAPKNANSTRGAYNISIHQHFRLNGTEFYTIFNLPVSITNEIKENEKRVSCDFLKNELLSQKILDASADYIPPSHYPGTNGGAVQTDITDGVGMPTKTSASTSATSTSAGNNPFRGLESGALSLSSFMLYSVALNLILLMLH